MGIFEKLSFKICQNSFSINSWNFQYAMWELWQSRYNKANNILNHIFCIRPVFYPSVGRIFFHQKDTEHCNLRGSFLASIFLFVADHQKQLCLPSDEKSHNPVCLHPLDFVIYIKLKCEQYPAWPHPLNSTSHHGFFVNIFVWYLSL